MKQLVALAVTALLLASCGANTATPPISPADTTSAQSAQPQALQSQALQSLDAAAAVPESTTNFGGFAEGSAYAAGVSVRTNLGTQVLSGPVAPAQLNCSTASTSASNSVLTITTPSFVQSGTAADNVTTSYSTTTGSVASTSTVQGVNLLGGLVRATVVKAQANSGANATSATSNETGSQFTGLVVAGIPILVQPAPNTKVSLGALGYVILNEEYGVTNNVMASDGSRSTSMNVNMIHVYVTTANTLGIQVGTEIIVASAHSSFTVPPAPFAINATAYSLYAKGYAGNINAVSGPWAPASIGCHTLSDSNRLLSASTPVGSLGTMVNTALGSETASSTSARATSNTASTNLLSGLITAQTLVATANAGRSGATYTRSASLTFATLHVGGINVAVNVAPNTRINLAGLGYAMVNEQVGSVTTNGVAEEINAVHIYVNAANSYNLPVGAQIVIGHAHAGINGI